MQSVSMEPARDSTKQARLMRTPRLLHLFSGPADRDDGIEKLAMARGWHCESFDIVDGKDLSSDMVWCGLMKRVAAGEFDFAWTGTPCNTYSTARGMGPGPRVLRTLEHPYGLPDLTPAEKEQVRQATFLRSSLSSWLQRWMR